MKILAIQDANILIDLVSVGLFAHCLSLDYQFTTTDIVLAELHDEQVLAIEPHINSERFSIIDIDAETLGEITIAAEEDTRLSVQDWSVLFYAQKKDGLLLTGDKRLRTLAKQKGITVCGVLWILDELVERIHLTPKDAHTFLQELQVKNKRLPADECSKRLKMWGGE